MEKLREGVEEFDKLKFIEIPVKATLIILYGIGLLYKFPI